jgi:hypothetical protein
MTDYSNPYPDQDGGTTTTDTAKDEARGLKDKATESGGQLLGEAKSEAAAVTQEARRQLGDLWGQARTEVSGQVGTQQSRLAGGLTSVGDQLTQMAGSTGEQNIATDIAREIGDRVTAAGRWLDEHGPDEALDEVRSFARRRPGTFLLIAAGAGVVLGRLTRGLKDATSDGGQDRTQSAAPTRTATLQPPVYTETIQESGLDDELATPLHSDSAPSVETTGTATTAPGAPTTGTPVPSTTGWDQR